MSRYNPVSRPDGTGLTTAELHDEIAEMSDAINGITARDGVVTGIVVDSELSTTTKQDIEDFIATEISRVDDTL